MSETLSRRLWKRGQFRSSPCISVAPGRTEAKLPRRLSGRDRNSLLLALQPRRPMKDAVPSMQNWRRRDQIDTARPSTNYQEVTVNQLQGEQLLSDEPTRQSNRGCTNAIVHVDDVLVCGETFEEFCDALRDVLLTIELIRPNPATAVTSPLHPAAGAGAGVSPWLGPGLHLKGDTAPSGLLFVPWELISSCRSVKKWCQVVQCWVGACVCAVKGSSRQPSDELRDGLDSQVSGDDVVSDVPPGPRNQAERYVLLGLETLALQSRAKGIPSRCSVGQAGAYVALVNCYFCIYGQSGGEYRPQFGARSPTRLDDMVYLWSHSQ
ncbi:hypothetical protein EVAR_49751_1 [Eumeta japonica]|uniref:Reverse transcriptase domain-containing protein n=1 Tax=Eumeta variegata TaxID=151549 RepID=A0A4C1YAU8_EUMVA|nr:hypothetical protein EVAR_49751_1 [Eumeta japonica]